jgi:hypothetical protein
MTSEQTAFNQDVSAVIFCTVSITVPYQVQRPLIFLSPAFPACAYACFSFLRFGQCGTNGTW